MRRVLSLLGRVAMLLNEIAPFVGVSFLLWFAGYMLGYQSGREAGIKLADYRNELDRQHRARVIAELDAGRKESSDAGG